MRALGERVSHKDPGFESLPLRQLLHGAFETLSKLANALGVGLDGLAGRK